jgi:predicted O-methyltransferase YrrM
LAPGRVGEVTRRYGHLKYLRESQALVLRDLIRDNDLSELLEIGIFHGKGTAYLAATLEDLGRGHLTALDLDGCRRKRPNVDHILASLDLTHRVRVRLHPRSATVTLLEMLEERPRPRFDFCYLDACPTWDVTGLLCLLADLLLEPRGWIVLHDLDRTAADHVRRFPEASQDYPGYTEAEMHMRHVRKAFEVLLRDRGYRNAQELVFEQDLHGGMRVHWGIAQKG